MWYSQEWGWDMVLYIEGADVGGHVGLAKAS